MREGKTENQETNSVKFSTSLILSENCMDVSHFSKGA